jgi:hypothetical protein
MVWVPQSAKAPKRTARAEAFATEVIGEKEGGQKAKDDRNAFGADLDKGVDGDFFGDGHRCNCNI